MEDEKQVVTMTEQDVEVIAKAMLGDKECLLGLVRSLSEFKRLAVTQDLKIKSLMQVIEAEGVENVSEISSD